MASRSVPLGLPVTPSVKTVGVNIVGVMRSYSASRDGRSRRRDQTAGRAEEARRAGRPNQRCAKGRSNKYLDMRCPSIAASAPFLEGSPRFQLSATTAIRKGGDVYPEQG